MGEVTIKLNGIERRVPEGITILEAARDPHTLLSERYQRDRRLPDVRCRSKRSKKPGGFLCLPGQ